MAQHDYDIANDTAANVRADINNVLAAIVSNNSGTSEPATTYANQWWYDSTNDILKIRNEADTAWIDFATLDQTNGVWKFPTDAAPDTDSTYNLGESSLRWANLYVDNVSDGTDTVGTEYVVNGSAKAWFNYNQASVEIRNTLNVSSITDDSTALFTVNFTNDFTGIDYSMGGQARSDLATHNGTISNREGAVFSSSALQLVTRTTDSNAFDCTWASGNIHGDLA